MIQSCKWRNEAGGVRLDAALLLRFPSTTRALVRDAIAAGEILVDGRKTVKGAKLRAGQEISVASLAEAADNIVAPNPGVALALVHEDSALLAFDKPCGISVHPIARAQLETLANGVAARWPECAALGDRPLCGGALHRIDSGTSGLVMFARTAGAFEAMRAQFSAQTIEKKYIALVEGEISAAGTLENDLAHDPTLPHCKMIDCRHNRLTLAQRARLRPLHAVTAFKPVALAHVENETRTLLEITIFTGVTHQIRAQLALAGMHIVNDRLYGAFAIEGQDGHCLHALSATFRHPATSAPCTLSTPLPPWARCLA